MKKICSFGILFTILFSILLTFTGCIFSETSTGDPTIPRFTETTGWWIDTTNKVDQKTIETLKAESIIAKKDGFQIAGAIFNNCVSDQMTFTTKVGNENGIGNADKDNGIIIAVFLDKKGSDGKSPAITIAIGKGLESLLNDAKVGRFLDQYFVPERKNGNWEIGLINTEKAIHNYLMNPEAKEYKDINNEGMPIWGWILIAFIGFILLIAIISGSESSGSSGGGFFSGGGDGGGSGLGGGGGFSGGGAGR